MLRYFEVHPVNPQMRLIAQVADIVREGGVIVYPTDSSYALACHIGDKSAVERIREIRKLDEKHNMTLVCRDLSEIATYAQVGNAAYRLLRAATPGPYTFLLDATREVPRRLQHPRRKTIGIRVPDHRITQALLATLGEPMISTTLHLPGDELPLSEPEEIKARLRHLVDAIVDSGYCAPEITTVVDLSGAAPVIVRRGRGDTAMFE
jgi:tRNA threonylcarbamoyl adenosine modification protein (Sua5/YciO/YrdC/YwlC family)